jgi:hypothetical protein
MLEENDITTDTTSPPVEVMPPQPVPEVPEEDDDNET